MMDNKTAIERMNKYINKCTLLGIEEFEFGFNEGLDEVHITKIHILF